MNPFTSFFLLGRWFSTKILVMRPSGVVDSPFCGTKELKDFWEVISIWLSNLPEGFLFSLSFPSRIGRLFHPEYSLNGLASAEKAQNTKLKRKMKRESHGKEYLLVETFWENDSGSFFLREAAMKSREALCLKAILFYWNQISWESEIKGNQGGNRQEFWFLLKSLWSFDLRKKLFVNWKFTKKLKEKEGVLIKWGFWAKLLICLASSKTSGVLWEENQEERSGFARMKQSRK